LTFKLPFFSYRSELQIAVNAVMEAGKEIMKIYETDFSSRLKTDNSPITQADINSNKIIKKILSKSDHTILSEESKDDKSRLKEKVMWVVDPLDGTTDFVNRTGEFTIMTALVEENKPTLGVINCPSKNIMYVAQKGIGSYKFTNNFWKKMAVSKISDLEESRAIGSRYHMSNKEREFLKKLKIREFTNVGSSLKVGKISAGEAEIYLTMTDRMKEWDTCASYCIISEAGGKMTDMLGNDLTYNNEQLNHQNGILVTNGLIHEKVVKKYLESK
jgi:3'(2'), 5'-bisphosphate nucleotidase